MNKKHHSGLQILDILREADKLLSQGFSVAYVCKKLHIKKSTYNHWRRRYKNMSPETIDKLRPLHKKYLRLKFREAEHRHLNNLLIFLFLLILVFLLLWKLVT